MSRKIGATIVTGFLGAGKTSLIRHLAAAATGRRLAFIINEFGDLGIDRAILEGCAIPGCSADEIVELANGCICCTVADDFLPTLEKLLDRADPPEHIIIETSGLALPKPLVQAFNWPAVKPRVTVDGVVVVVDAPAVLAGDFAEDLDAIAAQRAADPSLDHDNPLAEVFVDQLAVADMVVLNKTEDLSQVDLARLEAEIAARLRPGVKLIRASHGKVPAEVAIGLAAAVEDDLAARPAAHDSAEHDHDDFESFIVSFGAVADFERLTRGLASTAADPSVLRVKGFVAVAGSGRRGVVQGVGRRFERYFDRDWRPGEAVASALVVIGRRGLDRAAITASILAAA